MRQRIQAAKEELNFDRSSFYLGLIFGAIIMLLLSTVIAPLVFGVIGTFVPDPNAEPDAPEINADIIINDMRESDDRMLLQLAKEPNATSIYVVSDSDSDYTADNSTHYIGVKGNATVGSTVSVSIGQSGGDVTAQSGETVQVIGVKDGHEEVLYEFEA